MDARRIKPLIFCLATAGELIGLSYWLYWLDAGFFLRGSAALWAGFAVERISVAWWLRRTQTEACIGVLSPIWKTAVGLFGITVLEIGMWHALHGAARYWNPEIGGMLLFLLIHPLHAGEMAAVRRQSSLQYILRPRTVLFSFCEALGGALWIGLVTAGHPRLGFAALLIALTLEHFLQGTMLQEQDVIHVHVAKAIPQT